MEANRSAWDEFPAIANAQRLSLDVIAKLNVSLADVSPHIKTVAVTGSLARLDASESSDCDLIVVLDDDQDATSNEAADITRDVYRRAADCGLLAADPTGIYRQPTTAIDLLDPKSVGVVDERMDVFGKRMQLLIESRPVIGTDAYRDLLIAILDRYMQPCDASVGVQETDYLLNDLIRYYRSYRVAKQWAPSSKRDGWYLKQVKVHHTRLLTYATTIMLLGEYSTDSNYNRTHLLRQLAQSPLDRVRSLYEKYGVPSVTIFNAFSSYLIAMAEPETRGALSGSGVSSDDVSNGQPPVVYAALIENGNSLADALFEFIIQKYGDRLAPFLRRLVL